MADGKKNQEMGFEKKTNNNNKANLLPIFSRSLTVHSSTVAVAENKSIYNPNHFHPFQRNGSIKSLHSSPFVSMVSPGNPLTGKVRKLCSIFDLPKHTLSSQKHSQSSPLPSPTSPKPQKLLPFDSSNGNPKIALSTVSGSPIRLPGTENSVVIYYTSLRGVRRTFQDCHSVRMIFRGFRMNLDERDISMDSCYRMELQNVLGVDNVSLPQVFIKGKHIGGADLIKHLVEVGELAKLIKGLPLRSMKPCDACDDARFILCTNCNGSRKVFDETAEQPRRCPECNENGLIRCPLCCSHCDEGIQNTCGEYAA